MNPDALDGDAFRRQQAASNGAAPRLAVRSGCVGLTNCSIGRLTPSPVRSRDQLPASSAAERHR
jgi:hypothetical protein